MNSIPVGPQVSCVSRKSTPRHVERDLVRFLACDLIPGDTIRMHSSCGSLLEQPCSSKLKKWARLHNNASPMLQVNSPAAEPIRKGSRLSYPRQRCRRLAATSSGQIGLPSLGGTLLLWAWVLYTTIMFVAESLGAFVDADVVSNRDGIAW